MDNNNNHNQNGKEVHKDHTLRNGQKGNSARPVNKIKKNNPISENETRPTEPKKISLNTNRTLTNQRKNNPKGQVIKLEDKANKIHPVDTSGRENRRTYPKTSSPKNINTAVIEPSSIKEPIDNTTQKIADNQKFSIPDATGKWLLVVAVLLFIAWAVMFFYYHNGGNTHMLLAFAVICAVISLIGKRKK